jgi:hypothetical protein
MELNVYFCMAKRPVVRGNPAIDKQMVAAAQSAAIDLQQLRKDLAISKRNLDMESLYAIGQQMHVTASEISMVLAHIEEMKRIRIKQSTALVGGKRRKAR